MKELKGTNARSLTRASATIIKGESRGKAGQAGDHRHPTPTPSRNNDAQESTLIVSDNDDCRSQGRCGREEARNAGNAVVNISDDDGARTNMNICALARIPISVERPAFTSVRESNTRKCYFT